MVICLLIIFGIILTDTRTIESVLGYTSENQNQFIFSPKKSSRYQFLLLLILHYN